MVPLGLQDARRENEALTVEHDKLSDELTRLRDDVKRQTDRTVQLQSDLNAAREKVDAISKLNMYVISY